MKIGACVLILLLALAHRPLMAADHRVDHPALGWERTDTSLALQNHGKTVWRLVFDPAKPKSYFHPLATLEGEVLTGFEPADHPWHRGLWWSWKFINGVNYWEESAKSGQSEGLTRLVRANPELGEDYSARVEMDIHYHPPEQKPVLVEKRQLAISRPDADGTYRIDWKSEFTAIDQLVLLERTLPAHLGGVPYGGYAGLSLRMAQGLEGFSFQTSTAQTDMATCHGKAARWVDLAGPRSGIAILDHPDNPRHEAPWYLHSSRQMLFMGPAPLFNQSLELKPGQSIAFSYRVIVHSNPLAAAEIDAVWRSFALR